MKIADNVIKYHLRNVRFITGGAFGGKTTMAKLLAEKHGFKRYREGDMWDQHRSYAIPDAQPAMCVKRNEDWNAFFNQPVEKYHRWLSAGLAEEAEMAIVDLMRLAETQIVVADVMIPVEILRFIADYRQVVILYAPVEMKRRHYFDREDKKPVLDLIATMHDPKATLENVLNALTYRGEEEIQGFLQSGFKCLGRNSQSTIEGTFAEIEEHFGLSSLQKMP